MSNEITLQDLIANKQCIHVIGRTAYRSATITDMIFECKRDEIAFIENQLKTQDNHIVIIFQVLYNNELSGTYYAFVTDFWCLVGKNIQYGEF